MTEVFKMRQNKTNEEKNMMKLRTNVLRRLRYSIFRLRAEMFPRPPDLSDVSFDNDDEIFYLN